MDLNEMAEEYLYAAQVLTQQIEELRVSRHYCGSANATQALNQQMAKLRTERRDCEDIADHLLHYYRKGGHIYEWMQV